MKVGFIGLGNMGRAMARNLIKAGADLVVFDIQPAAMQDLAQAGATAASSLADLTRAVDVVFTSLPGPAEVEEVAVGPEGVVHHMRPGLPLFDLSTNSLSTVRRLSEVFSQRGGMFLDAPVSGGPPGAMAGTLGIWVGGDRAAYDRHLDLLRAMGAGTRHMGAIGTGTVTKLAHNMIGNMMFLALAEGFSLGVKGGVDPLDLWQALNEGSIGRNTATALLVNQFLPAKFDPPAFALKLAHKDVTLAAALGKELGVPLRLTNMTLEEMTEAMTRGMGNLDTRAFMTLQMQRAGVDVSVAPERVKDAVAAARR